MSSLKNLKWVLQDKTSENLITDIIQRRFALYKQNDIDNFLNPEISYFMPKNELCNVSNMSNMIIDAKKIGVFVDYDVDGVSSGAMWSLFFDEILKDHVMYFPSRADGYGPSEAAISFFRTQECDLILFLDCGTNAASIIDLIDDIKTCVLDHHLPSDKIAESLIVNPYLSGQREYFDICTAGLSFFVLSFLDKTFRTELPDQLLDLVSLGTVADCVRLNGINRAYVRKGIEKLRSNPRPGLKALLNKQNRNINAGALAYFIAPCLNAAGRLDTSETAFQSLVSKSYLDASETAQSLINLNNARKNLELEMISLAEHQVENQAGHQDNALVVYHEDWHPGIVGIIAGRIKEKYDKTTFAFYKKNGIWSGSARSAGHDLADIIQQGKDDDIIKDGGGHSAAAGVSIFEDKFELFKDWIKQKQSVVVERILYIDYVADVGQKLPDLSKLSPFGYGNPNVKILIKNLIIKNVTQYGQHLKIVFSNHSSQYFFFRAANIWRQSLKFSTGKTVDIVISADECNSSIEDIRLCMQHKSDAMLSNP